MQCASDPTPIIFLSLERVCTLGHITDSCKPSLLGVLRRPETVPPGVVPASSCSSRGSKSRSEGQLASGSFTFPHHRCYWRKTRSRPTPSLCAPAPRPATGYLGYLI